jgi:hypothetical protein
LYGFGFRVSGFGFRVSGFGFRVAGFEFRVTGEGDTFTGRAIRGYESVTSSDSAYLDGIEESETAAISPEWPVHLSLAGGSSEAAVADCPVCGLSMVAIRGSKDAVCGNCGFKDSCCY